MSTQFHQVFASTPEDIRERLENHYREIKHNFALRKFGPSELNAGKLCEDVYRVLEWYASTTKEYTPYGTQILKFKRSVRKFECMSDLDDSVRFHIPDVLCAIYNIRNKRGVSHSPGEIDPNFMDATLVAGCVDWIMAELIRLLHNVDIDEARTLIESIVTKEVPIVWQIGDRRRVLDTSLSEKQAVLALLYFDYPQPVDMHQLVKWVDSNNPSRIKTQHLPALHKSRLIDFEKCSGLVRLSPLGAAHVEAEIPLEMSYA